MTEHQLEAPSGRGSPPGVVRNDVVLTVVLETGGGWRGTVRIGDGPREHFDGWVGLMAATDRVLGTQLGEHPAGDQ